MAGGDRKKLSVLKRKVEEAKKKTEEAASKRREKMAKKVAVSEEQNEPLNVLHDGSQIEIQLFEKSRVSKKSTDKTKTTEKKKAEKKEPKKNVVKFKLKDVDECRFSAEDVYRWFKVALRKKYGKRFVVGTWNIKHKTLAKKMIGEYGPDLTMDAVKYFIEQWDDLVASSNGRLGGVPTFGLMWAMRDRIFGIVQTLDKEPSVPKKSAARKNSDEFKGTNGKPKVGW